MVVCVLASFLIPEIFIEMSTIINDLRKYSFPSLIHPDKYRLTLFSPCLKNDRSADGFFHQTTATLTNLSIFLGIFKILSLSLSLSY